MTLILAIIAGLSVGFWIGHLLGSRRASLQALKDANHVMASANSKMEEAHRAYEEAHHASLRGEKAFAEATRKNGETLELLKRERGEILN